LPDYEWAKDPQGGIRLETRAIWKVGLRLGRKIVVVDDDRLVLQSVSDALEASGFEVWATDSTERAVELSREVEPDVLVTDYRMPGMDGVSLLEQVKEQAAVRLMLVYSATPPPRGRLTQQMQEVHWVAKSAGHEALLGKLNEMLEGSVDRR
jgi:CheY-like chemotaxis protein